MTGKNYRIESAAISDKGLSKKRPQNEDSYLELNAQGIFAVADGVGGAQAGDVASQMAMEILGEAFVNLPSGGDVEELMKLAIERANEAIFRTSQDLASLSTMATTIVAVHISNSIATIGHVGDSRLYRLDPQGNLHRETDDHSMVEEEVRAGRMTAEQAANHPSKNIISRALGAEEAVDVDTKTILVEPHTKFLVCSDGVTRHIDDFQLRELLRFKDAPDNICQRIKEICYERGAEDNLTAVIAEITDTVIQTPVVSKMPLDLEEPTLATARVAPPAEPVYFEEEIPTQPLMLPKAATPPVQPFVREEKPEMPVPVVVPTPAVAPVTPLITEKESESQRIVEKSNSGFGKLMSSILLLIVGGILGIGGYYFWSQNTAATIASQSTPQLSPQLTNIEQSSFENLRRSVDADPNNYINKNAAITQDVEGLYLLGRAYLLVGKFPEAKKYLAESRDKLAQANSDNNRVLATDIALGLAIVDEAAAQNKFQNSIKVETSEPKSAVNSNSSVRSGNF